MRPKRTAVAGPVGTGGVSRVGAVAGDSDPGPRVADRGSQGASGGGGMLADQARFWPGSGQTGPTLWLLNFGPGPWRFGRQKAREKVAWRRGISLPRGGWAGIRVTRTRHPPVTEPDAARCRWKDVPPNDHRHAQTPAPKVRSPGNYLAGGQSPPTRPRRRSQKPATPVLFRPPRALGPCGTDAAR